MDELSMSKLKTTSLYVRKNTLMKGDVVIDGTLTITKSTDFTPELETTLTTLINTNYTPRVPSSSPVELPLIRLTSANYDDGKGNVSGTLINPRVISNAVCAQPDDEVIEKNGATGGTIARTTGPSRPLFRLCGLSRYILLLLFPPARPGERGRR